MKHFYQTTAQLLVVLALLVLITTVSAAQETQTGDLREMSLEDLLNVKIEAATKTDVTQMEVPQAVTILNRADIEKTSANSLGELLRAVVGANVVRVQTSQNVLGARGSNAFAPSKVLILIDGQPIDPTLFSTTWWELVPVSLNDIERIEVVRSPGTIYGANAQNGVVNIITQKINLEEKNGHRVRALGKSGQQNMRQGFVGYAGKLNGITYRFSTELTQVNAYENGAGRERAVQISA
jgi:iron complex outermembrane receptor protein